MSLFCKSQGRTELLFGQEMDAWLEDTRLRVKRSTHATYRGVAECHVRPKLGGVPLKSLTSECLAKFLAEEEKTVSPATMRLVCRVLRGAVGKAREDGLHVPASSVISAPRLPCGDAHVLPDVDVDALEGNLLSKPDLPRLGLLICLRTGLRLGEICALKWGDFSPDATAMSIRRTVQRVTLPPGEGEGGARTAVMFGTPKSERSNRVIPVPKSLAPMIQQFRGADDCFVLTGRPDAAIEPRRMQNRFKRELRACGAGDINFHAMRHTFATDCVRKGCDPTTLSRVLGHGDVSLTLDIYVHPSFESMRELMDKL